MSLLPGNRIQQNMETGSPGLTAEKSPQQVHGPPGCFAVCPFLEAGDSGELTGWVCGNTVSVASGTPREASGPFPKEQKCNRGAPSWARSLLRSHLGNPESFPSVCAWGFPGLSLPQASPCGCGSQVCGLGVSTPQGRQGWAGWGESRQHRLSRKTPLPQGCLLRPG